MEYEYQKTNREKTLSPKRGLCWCYGCDMALVGTGRKCPVCGKRHEKRTLKKETSAT